MRQKKAKRFRKYVSHMVETGLLQSSDGPVPKVKYDVDEFTTSTGQKKTRVVLGDCERKMVKHIKKEYMRLKRSAV